MMTMCLAPERRGRRLWLAPTLVFLTGLGVLGFLAQRGETGPGLIAGAVLAGYALQLAYRREENGLAVSESFGQGRRGRSHLKAAAMTGDALVAGLVGVLIVQALRGADLGLLPWLAALAAVVYLVSIVIAGEF
jgi:hypothetical protein